MATETVLIVGVYAPDLGDQEADSSLSELQLLSRTAGARVVGRYTQRRPAPHVKNYVGKGKAEEIAHSVRGRQIATVVFDDELTPSQQRNLEAIFSC